MELGEILGYVFTAIGSGTISSLATWKLTKRQKQEEVNGTQIDNISNMIEKIYTPVIDQLSKRIDELNDKVRQLEREKEEERKAHAGQIEEINKNCEEKSAKLKEQILELAQELANKKDKQPRNPRGQFAKSGGAGNYNGNEGGDEA